MRKHPLTWSLAVAIVAALSFTGCADEGSQPLAPLTYEALAPQAKATDLASGLALETTGQHLVVFRNQIPADFEAQVAALGGAVETVLDGIGVVVVSGLSEEAVGRIARIRGVAALEPDLVMPFEAPEAEEVVELDERVHDSHVDPTSAGFWPRQWHHRAIFADVAWANGYTGSSDVVVAILDTGIDYTHASLEGLVDLERSVSFLPSDDEAVEEHFPGMHPIADLDRHGTHVASTIVSTGEVVAGVTAHTTLFGVKICGYDRGCPRSATLEAIMYAADNGADVINMSLGGYMFRSEDRGRWLPLILRATNYAHRQGSLVVVSAGNAGEDLDRNKNEFKIYCDAPNVVCVSGMGPTWRGSVNGPWNDFDQFWTGSNYGRSAIDVAAPSGNTGNFVYAGCSSTSVVKNPVCQGSKRYSVGLRGTSMAAPHATGVAALIAAYSPRAKGNPALIRNRLHQTADVVDGYGNSPYFGKGRINAARAVGLNVD